MAILSGTSAASASWPGRRHEAQKAGVGHQLGRYGERCRPAGGTPGHLDRHLGLDLRQLARTLLSVRGAEEGLADLVWVQLPIDRNQRIVLPHAIPGSCARLAQADAARLRLCVEGVEIHHALETAERHLRKLDRIDGVETEATRARRQDLSSSSCPEISKPTANGWRDLSRCCLRAAATHSSSVIPRGTSMVSLTCWPPTTFPFVLRITTLRPRRGSRPPTTCMCADTDPMAATGTTIQPQRCANGHDACVRGNGRAGGSTFISTTIRRVPRLRMPGA